MSIVIPLEPKNGAVISECGHYRYLLWRTLFDSVKPPIDCVFVMLNPSIADATKNDPTINICVDFCMRWGFSRLVVVNLFALIATDPKKLKADPEPIGPLNDDYINMAVWQSDRVICAWGANCEMDDRHERVKEMLISVPGVYHLGLTKKGHPRHPLYLKRTTVPIQWKQVQGV